MRYRPPWEVVRDNNKLASATILKAWRITAITLVIVVMLTNTDAQAFLREIFG